MKKINKKLLVIVAIFLLSVLVSGCSDALDINEKTIVTAILLDLKDGEINYYMEIANIEENNTMDKGKSNGDKYIFIKGKGKTIPEAQSDLDRQLHKPPYLSGLRTLVLTENFAKEYLVDYLNEYRSEESYRKKVMTVITKHDIEDILKANHEKNISVGFSVEEILKTLEEDGESFSRTTSRILENLSTKYTGILIPCMGLKDKKNALIGYSIVNGTTINGFIPSEESRGTIYLKSDKTKFSYVVPYKDNKFTIEMILKKRKIKPSYKDGKINMNLKFEFKDTLIYSHKKTPYNFDDAANEEVTKMLTETIKKEITDAIDLAQKKFKCDYLQFDDEFRIKYPVLFEKMDWQKEFEKVSYNVDAKVDLREPLMMDYKEKEQK